MFTRGIRAAVREEVPVRVHAPSPWWPDAAMASRPTNAQQTKTNLSVQEGVYHPPWEQGRKNLCPVAGEPEFYLSTLERRRDTGTVCFYPLNGRRRKSRKKNKLTVNAEKKSPARDGRGPWSRWSLNSAPADKKKQSWQKERNALKMTTSFPARGEVARGGRVHALRLRRSLARLGDARFTGRWRSRANFSCARSGVAILVVLIYRLMMCYWFFTER